HCRLVRPRTFSARAARKTFGGENPAGKADLASPHNPGPAGGGGGCPGRALAPAVGREGVPAAGRSRAAASGLVEPEFPADGGTAWEVPVSPAGRKVATAGGLGLGSPGKAEVSDAATGRHLYTPTGHDPRYQISGVSWSPDGKRLATASHDRTARLWDA